ncbi:MAG: outer membrane lipoprotein-sorting protein, partial [Silvibacterium sp.]
NRERLFSSTKPPHACWEDRLRPFVLIAVVLLALSTTVATADVPPILTAPRARVQTADYRVSGRLVSVDATGRRINYAVTIKAHWFPGVLRVMVDVTSPVAAREHVLLEMRPEAQDAISLAKPGDTSSAPLPFSQWSDGVLGGMFSYEDFLEPEYFWPGQTVIEETKRGARDCVVLKSTPGLAERTHYADVRSWLDKAIGFPVYVEKTLKGSSKVKTFTYYGLRHEEGVWSATQIEAAEHGKPGSTLLIFERGTAKANLGLKDFSREAMIHF